MSEEVRKKAVEMLLNGATLVSEPCPYCKGVRVMKDGNALCVSCGKSPNSDIEVKNQEQLEEQVIWLLGDAESRRKAGQAARQWKETHTGATGRTIEGLMETLKYN